MKYLKEDGSLDVERINKLPLEERLHEIGKFTREQVEVYFSKVPIKESSMSITPVKVDYKMEDLLARGYATAEQILRIIDDSM